MNPLWEGGRRSQALRWNPVPPQRPSHPIPGSTPTPCGMLPRAGTQQEPPLHASAIATPLTTPRLAPLCPPNFPTPCGSRACLLCPVLQLSRVSTDEAHVQTSFIHRLIPRIHCADCVLQCPRCCGCRGERKRKANTCAHGGCFLGKSIPGRWRSKCKGPGTKAGGLHNSMESIVPWAMLQPGGQGTRSWGLQCPRKGFGFYSQ